MKFYRDTETGEIIPESVLQADFKQLQTEDPETYNYSFSDYIRNCTNKNGFLEEVNMMYLNVWELSRDQLNELKENYYYDVLSEAEAENYLCSEDIPDEIIFSHHSHTAFTNDDFFCTAGQ